MQTKGGFDIQFAYLAYIPPYPKGKGAVVPKLKVENIKSENKTTDYLFDIFDSASGAAKTEIIFNSDDKQFNPIRKNILDIAASSDKAKCKHATSLCNHLHICTDERNGNGLFAIIEGKKGSHTRFVLMRFKGDEGLVGSGNKRTLVGYMSEVFSKKSTHYKLAVYEDTITDKSFWKGYAEDRQISGAAHKTTSAFWVERVLKSRTAVTSAQGTMQFSKILKDLLTKSAGIVEQEQIISGIVNLKNKKGSISLADFCQTYLSPELAQRVEASTTKEFFNAVFTIDEEVYQKEFGKTALSMEGGIMAYVPTFSYDKHVKEEQNEDGSKTVTISAKLNSKRINVQPAKA